MIKLYTHWEDLNRAPYSILSNEAAFKGFCRRPEVYTDYVREVIKRVDSGILLDVNTGLVKMPRGVTTVKELSTGCKTVINAICCIRFNNTPAVINANECGRKALIELFKVVDNQDISLLLMNTDITKELYWRFTLNNGQEVEDCFSLRYRLAEIS